MGIFFPWNWPGEALALPLAILILVGFYGLLLLLAGLVFEFFWMPFSLKQARERAERNLKWPTEWLARHREESAQHLDKVLMLMRKHIDPTMTPEQAAALTPEDVRSQDWGDSAGMVSLHALDVKHMQDAFEREHEAKKMYDAANADYEPLLKANFWSYRWRNFAGKDWRGGIKTTFKFVAWLSAFLYFIGFVCSGYYSWVNNARAAVGQDYTVVSANFWTNSVTIEQDDCHITLPVNIDSSTEYSITGKGAADLDMVIMRDGEFVQPCLDRTSN